MVTSSRSAMVIGDPKGPGYTYTEADWNEIIDPSTAAYPTSKTLSERAAWEVYENQNRVCQGLGYATGLPRVCHGHARGLGMPRARVCHGYATVMPGAQVCHGYARGSDVPGVCHGYARGPGMPRAWVCHGFGYVRKHLPEDWTFSRST